MISQKYRRAGRRQHLSISLVSSLPLVALLYTPCPIRNVTEEYPPNQRTHLPVVNSDGWHLRFGACWLGTL